MTKPPKLAVGAGALGFWKALVEAFGTTTQQRCCVHPAANILNKRPKSVQPEAKAALHEIWMAETHEETDPEFDLFVETYETKYPKATKCLDKDRRELLGLRRLCSGAPDLPEDHQPYRVELCHRSTTNREDRNCLSRAGTLSMVFKLCQAVQQEWRRLHGYKLLGDLIRDVRFAAGIRNDRIGA